MTRKIAVVGGGIFGTTIAIKLAKNFKVDLYEKSSEILTEASAINQFRLHRGYHYPRSIDTALSAKSSYIPFLNQYKSAVNFDTDCYYAIAKRESKTSSKKYIQFLDYMNLAYKVKSTPLVNKNKIALSIVAKENLIDYKKLKKLISKNLMTSGVNVLLNTTATKNILKKYDFSIICSYSSINKLIEPKFQRNYQFEICEKIIIELPKKFKNTSIVIMDGPFMCIDPFGNSKYHLMGNVVHAIHSSNVGRNPKIPHELKGFLNKGIIKNPKFTNFNKFIDSAIQFIPDIKYANHIGSMYTIRTVLPNKDETDERPTIVKRLDNKTFMVFSGKISSCVVAAQEIYDFLSD